MCNGSLLGSKVPKERPPVVGPCGSPKLLVLGRVLIAGRGYDVQISTILPNARQIDAHTCDFRYFPDMVVSWVTL